MLILISIDVQYPQKGAFRFEKGSNHQNHSSLGSLHLVRTPSLTATQKLPLRIPIMLPDIYIKM